MKKIFILSVLVATVVCLAGFGIYIARGLSLQNALLTNHVRLLEKNIDALNGTLRQYQESEKQRLRDEATALNYLKWKFILKDQVSQARDRLTAKSTGMKDVKKDKDLANLIYYNLGLSCILAADFSSAISAFEQAIKYNPKDADSYYDLGLLYSVFSKDQNKAVGYFNRYLELVPKGIKSDDVKERIETLKNK